MLACLVAMTVPCTTTFYKSSLQKSKQTKGRNIDNRPAQYIMAICLARQTYTHQLVSDASDLTLARPSPVSWKFASVDISSLGCCEGETERNVSKNKIYKSICKSSRHQTLVLLHKCPSVLVLKNSPAFESNQLAVDGANRSVILWPRPNQKYGVNMLHPLKADLCTKKSILTFDLD